MAVKKLLTVASNGQISIGKAWAGKQIIIEEVAEGELHIKAGTFVPESQKTFYTVDARQSLNEFDLWEEKNPAKATDTKILFNELKKKRKSVGK